MVFKGSKVNKRIKRRIKNDTISEIISESELNLVSKKEEDNENYYNIGLDGYTVKSYSNLNVVQNKDDKILKKKN